MKLKKLELDNIGKFTKFEIVFDGKITHLIGMNGAGKTYVGLNGIWIALKGIAENNRNGQLIGERFRFIGNNRASADVKLTLVDELKDNAEIVVKNHITKQKNEITFEAPENYPINNEWLSNLLSVAFLSAKNFTQLSQKEQALLLGINTDKFDAEITDLKAEYTLINKELRSYGELIEPEKAEYVDVTDIVKFNDEQKERQNIINTANNRLSSLKSELEKQQETVAFLEKQLADAKLNLANIEDNISKGNKYISELPKPEKLKPIDSIVEQNKKYEAYKTYLKDKELKDSTQEELDKNKQKQAAKETERLNYIKSFNFGFDGLTVDEKGGLLLSGRPIKEPYFSKGELEIIVAKLYASQNPDLTVRFIDDFELLDEDNQAKITKMLIDAGFQIITARVGKKAGDNMILLRECKIANTEQETLL